MSVIKKKLLRHNKAELVDIIMEAWESQEDAGLDEEFCERLWRSLRSQPLWLASVVRRAQYDSWDQLSESYKEVVRKHARYLLGGCDGGAHGFPLPPRPIDKARSVPPAPDWSRFLKPP